MQYCQLSLKKEEEDDQGHIFNTDLNWYFFWLIKSECVPMSYLKQAQYVGHHDGDRTGRGTDNPYNPLWFGDDWRASSQAFYVRAVLLDQSLNEGERLFQSVGVP